MTAIIKRVGFEVDAIDVFCGFGGSSQGIHAAGAKVIAAANHNQLSLECHAANFPETDHWQADLVDPTSPMVINRNGKKVPGRYLDPAHLPRARYAWFSPSCTHHSQANATKIYERGLQISMFEDEDWDEQAFVNSERSRVTMSCVLRYVEARQPEIVAVENVLEVTKWGRHRDGSTFKWWMQQLQNLGYEVKLCFFNSMFFAPCPQSRDRIYIVAWRKGNKAPDLDYRPTAYCTSDRCAGRMVSAVQTWKPRKASWVTEVWGKYLAQYDYRCPDCRAVVHPASWMALTAIDWSDLGPTLEERIARGNRPAESTWERIRRAVAKYRNAPPIILPDGAANGQHFPVGHADKASTVSTGNAGSDLRHAGNRSRSVAEQLPTLAQRNTIGLALDTAVIPIRSGRPRADHPTEPLATVMAGGSHLALMIKHNGGIEEAGYRGKHIAEPLGSITAHPTQSVIALVVPNRTNNSARHAGEQMVPIMTSATEAIVVVGAGHTSEREGQTRAKHATEQLFAQSATNTLALASLPVLRGGDHTQEGHAAEQVATLAANGNHQAVVTALFSKINGGPGDTAWHGMDDPLNTITGRDTTGLVVVPWIDQWLSDPIYVTEQLATLTARMRHSLASLAPSDEPITDEMLMGVRFRMLQPDPELRRAMAFGSSYVLLGNKTEMTAGLGNAVTPPVADWITQQCLATLMDQPSEDAA